MARSATRQGLHTELWLGVKSTFSPIGSVMQKTVPRGSFGVAQSRPPCRRRSSGRSTTLFPGRWPWSYRKPRTCARRSPETAPDPNRCTTTSTLPASTSLVLICNSRDPSLTSLIASMAFMIKFSITCCRWTLSPETCGRPSASRIFAKMPLSDIAPRVSPDNLQNCSR